MKNRIKFLSIIFVLCISLVGRAQDTRGYKLKVGDKAPNFELQTSDGDKIMLDELNGKVVMLQFTATWCRVCIEEMPHIESEIWNKLKDNKNFALYGVMYKQGEQDAAKMRKLSSVTYPLALDGDGSIFHKFADKGAGVTRNVIVNKDGEIAFLTRLYNKDEFNAMVKTINKLITE